MQKSKVQTANDDDSIFGIAANKSMRRMFAILCPHFRIQWMLVKKQRFDYVSFGIRL